MPPRPSTEDKRRCLLLNNCLVVVCRRVDRDSNDEEPQECPGRSLFQGFVQENAQCFWNQCLVQSVTCLEYRGYVIPSTIFVSGTAYSLEVVRSAWSRRVLRPPIGYEIQRLGDVTSVEMVQVLQTQFAPLAEALCKAVFDVTSRGDTATLDTISIQLKSAFPGMERPGSDVVYRALGALIRERRLYHTGVGYQVAAPDTFLQTSPSPGPKERPMLLTNEEAITKLHGTPLVSIRGSHTTDIDSGADVSTLERSASMRLLRSRDRLVDDTGGSRLSRSCSVRLSRSTVQDCLTTTPRATTLECNGKRDKSGSMFSRWFRRSRSQKRSHSAGRTTTKKQLSTFSAQFPPSEWNDPDYVHFHSRATQTVHPDNITYSVIKPRSSSTTRVREHTSSNSETPDASLDRRSRSSRSSFRLPRKFEEPVSTFPYRHRSASPAARKNGNNRHTLPPPAPSRRLPSTSEVRTPPLQRKSYRHQRALPTVPFRPPPERLNNGGTRQDDRYKLTNFTNNALEPGKNNYEDLNNRQSMSLFDQRRSSIAAPFEVGHAKTTRVFPSQLKTESFRRETTFPVKNYPDYNRPPHVSAEDLKSMQKVGERPRSFASIKNLQCAPMVITKVTPAPSTRRTTFTTSDTVTLKNIQNLSSVGALDKAKPLEHTLNTLQTSQPASNTTTISIKQTNAKVSDADASDAAKRLATNLILEEKIESQRKLAPERTTGPVKRIVEEQSVQSTVESTGGKLGNLKSTVDVNMEVVQELGNTRTVTNISTCLSRGGAKTETPQESGQNPVVISKPVVIKPTKPCKTTRGSDSSIYVPSRSKLAEAKAAFFADSSNKGSADDSGFISTSPQPVPV